MVHLSLLLIKAVQTVKFRIPLLRAVHAPALASIGINCQKHKNAKDSGQCKQSRVDVAFDPACGKPAML